MMKTSGVRAIDLVRAVRAFARDITILLGHLGPVRDIRIAVLICTRLPFGSPQIGSQDLVRASWALPVAGALVGAIGAFVFWAAVSLRLPPPIAAALTLVATLLVTGCLHEDGLADTADGFGGGWDRERKLEIMHDSHLGAYGACALAMSLLLRWSALTAMASPVRAAAALVAAHVAARAALPAFMHVVPPARAEGLSVRAGQPALRSAALAAMIGILAMGLAMGITAMIIGLVLAMAAGFLMAWLCLRQIGGQTGDVLGALEQVIEVIILLTAVALSGLRL
jgi:adenosylcobinamide-GDP ribazoletransferase